MSHPDSPEAASPSPGLSLSVVIVCFAGGDALPHSLAAVRTELAGRADAEIVVARESPDDPLPGTTSVVLPPGSGPSRLRAAAVARARGAIVLVTEDHCVPVRGWVAAIEAAHAAGHDVVGGPIAPAPHLAGLDLASSLLAYGRYLPPLPDGPTSALSDCNVSYRRSTLASIEPVWRDAFVESDVHAALAGRGAVLWMAGAATVTQGRPVELARACHEQLVHGAEYALGRARRMPPGRRRLMRGATFLLPLVMTVRAARTGRRLGWPRTVGALPGLFRLARAWSSGERQGYDRAAGA